LATHKVTRRKKEEGRRKKEEGRRKKEEGRRQEVEGKSRIGQKGIGQKLSDSQH
jgi:hypothetical protein